METDLHTPNSIYQLNRYPKISNQTLRAWDAADEYILEELLNQKEFKCRKNLVIFNDAFGALTIALNSYQPTVISDSFICKKAIEMNYQDNQLDLDLYTFKNSLEDVSKPIDILIIKIPKSLDYLKYFLNKVRPNLNENSVVLLAGMMKNLPSSLWKSLENLLGTTQTSLAKKKAKIIQVRVEKKPSIIDFPKIFSQEHSNNQIYNHANVFSKDSLDIGTRFLLNQFPKYTNINKAIDLGCGNGIVGLNLAQRFSDAEITFTDESFMAVESARLTAKNNLDSYAKHQFIVNNCLDGFEKQKYDLIVCNPPFHQNHSIGLHIALQMFKQAHFCLKKGGKFIVIANRHLPYFTHLKRIFGKVSTIASNKKFNLYEM